MVRQPGYPFPSPGKKEERRGGWQPDHWVNHDIALMGPSPIRVVGRGEARIKVLPSPSGKGHLEGGIGPRSHGTVQSCPWSPEITAPGPVQPRERDMQFLGDTGRSKELRCGPKTDLGWCLGWFFMSCSLGHVSEPWLSFIYKRRINQSC